LQPRNQPAQDNRRIFTNMEMPRREKTIKLKIVYKEIFCAENADFSFYGESKSKRDSSEKG